MQLLSLISGTSQADSRPNFLAASETEIYLEGTREFLQALLDASVESRGEMQAVYLLLVENVELLEPHFIYELRSWGRETIPQLSKEKKVTIANALANLSRVIWALPPEEGGDPEIDLEIAIACNELALELLNSSEFPELWATINNNLALAYSERSLGDTVENDLKSYARYQQAQQVFSYQSFPEQWSKCS